MKFSKTEQECIREARMFRCKRSAPLWGVLAAIDKIAIEIRQPRKCDTPVARKH